jgi:hypothetical protein
MSCGLPAVKYCANSLMPAYAWLAHYLTWRVSFLQSQENEIRLQDQYVQKQEFQKLLCSNKYIFA